MRDADVADPLLYAIGARFVERLVVRYVVVYLAVRELCEGDQRVAREGDLPIDRGAVSYTHLTLPTKRIV